MAFPALIIDSGQPKQIQDGDTLSVGIGLDRKTSGTLSIGASTANLVTLGASGKRVTAPGGLTVGGGTLDASAVLEIISTTKGLLWPRMTTTQRDAISSPATSLLIFNTTTGQYEFYTGSAWSGIGGGTSIKHLASFTANDAIFPATTPAAASSRNGHALLAYDSGTDESAIFESVIPEYYDGTSAINVHLFWAADGVTTNDVVWNAQFEYIDPDTLDIDADSFATAQAVTDTAPGTDGHATKAVIAFTNAQADGIQGGDPFRLKVTRDADNGSDTMAADAQLLRVVVELQ